MTRRHVRSTALLALAATCLVAAAARAEDRRTISLDGEWQIAEGAMDAVPQAFERKVPVPGLVDMAQPAFEAVGEKDSAKRRQAFWYRRTFTVEGPVPAVAHLKIHKAAFGTRVRLNDKLVGDHLPCFTPALLDVREHLRGDGQSNELVVRVEFGGRSSGSSGDGVRGTRSSGDTEFGGHNTYL